MTFQLKGKAKGTKTVTVRLTDEWHADLVRIAAAKGVQAHEAARQMVEYCLKGGE